jgi:glucose-1-phosphate cytidylyltransferase
MQAVILAGGLGTRISEESHLRPKPMIEIGGKPILWHIMKIYSHYGVRDFIICGGYKEYYIKEWFANYFLHNSDVTIDLQNNSMDFHATRAESWRVTLVDTGLDTMTGGRLKRIKKYLSGEVFFMTYGDGVSNVNINALLHSHKNSNKLVSLTAVQPSGRFGALEIYGDNVVSFSEKPKGDGAWINGGFFVVNRAALEYIDGDSTIWEREPLERMASDSQLNAFKHTGFWEAMDTLRDKQNLESLWTSSNPPWKVW